MQQKRVNNKLYVLDFTPYVITEDTDVDIIYVQQEKLDAYVELNPSLADKIKTINYLVYTVKKKEWADDEPSPSEKKPTEITFNSSFHGFNQGDTGNFTDFISNPNELDYTFSVSDQGGNILDPSDNDYITWDSELNYTVQNQFGYNMNMWISRDEDSEWEYTSENKPTIIFPNSEEQAIQEQEIGSTFDEQPESLDIYLTPEILADMVADDKTEDLVANILNYRYVLNATCSYDGSVHQTALLCTQVVDTETGAISIGAIFDDTFHPIFNITQSEFGGSEQTNSIALAEDVDWVTIHKPANSDFYAIYLDGLSDSRYVHTDKLYDYTNDNDLNYHQSFVNYPFGQAWKIYELTDYSQSFVSSQSNAVSSYDGGYIITENPNNLPTNPFGIPCVEMVELTGSNHGMLTVNHPEGELWFIDLKNGTTTGETFAWIDVDTLSDYMITDTHEISVFKDGTHDLTTDNHVTAVDGIAQSDIYDNSFMMPGNNVEVNAEFWQATDVDLQVQYGGHAADHLIPAANFGPGTTDAELQVSQYIGYYEVDGAMESQEFGADEVEWSCDVPEITFNLISSNPSHWAISCDSNYTPDGSETATVSLVQGLHYAGSKEYTIVGEGS